MVEAGRFSLLVQPVAPGNPAHGMRVSIRMQHGAHRPIIYSLFNNTTIWLNLSPASATRLVVSKKFIESGTPKPTASNAEARFADKSDLVRLWLVL